MKCYLLLLALCWGFLPGQSQQNHRYTQTELHMKVKADSLDAVLLKPVSKGPHTLLILVSGSGPTDMDGNSWAGQSGYRNNALKMLADSLAKKGIASFRYDKRGIRPLKNYYLKQIPFDNAEMQRFEENIRFDDYVEDLDTIVRQLKKDKSFNKIVIAGHSEGSLIAMLAARSNSVSAFISISGPALTADSMILDQLKMKTKLEVIAESRDIIRKMKSGTAIDSITYPVNKSFFRPGIRPYLLSWFRHDPLLTLQSLKMPVMIVNGTADLQVSQVNAQSMHAAVPGSRLLIIKDMNHVLKVTPSAFENQLSYNHPTLPVSPELINGIEDFIKKLP